MSFLGEGGKVTLKNTMALWVEQKEGSFEKSFFTCDI